MLKQRIITAVILAILLIAATTLLSVFNFALFTGVVVLLASWEWNGFIGLSQPGSKIAFSATILLMLLGLFFLLRITPAADDIDQLRVSLVLGLGVLFWMLALMLILGYPENKGLWNDESKIASMGLLALIPAWVGLVELKYLLPQGYLVIAVILLVATVDIGGYFAGVNFGKRKLAPALSPKKSWEGVWGGVSLCMLFSVIGIWLLHGYVVKLSGLQLLLLLLLSLLVSFFSIIGDLLESMLKRNRQLKDSGTLLPGHGGVLDRVDGLIAANPVFVLIMMLVLNNPE